MNDSQIKKRFSKIPDSIPMKYHTIALENTYNQMGILAEGIMGLHEKVDFLGTKVDHLEEKVDRIDTRLTSVELDMMEVKNDVKDIKGTMVKKSDMKDPIKRIENLERVVLA